MRYKLPVFFSLIGIFFFNSCDQKKAGTKIVDTPVVITHIDSIDVYCDAAFKYMIDQEVSIYEVGNPDKHIHIIYKPETEVLKVLNTDSFATVIIGRRLKQAERDELYNKSKLQVDEHSFAKDAIAMVANDRFPKDTLPYQTVLALIANTSNQYKLVFEGNGSGVINYMFSEFNKSGARPSAFATKNTAELIDYLQKDNNVIGFIPFATISDEDDSNSRDLLKKVKLIYVSRMDSAGRNIVSTACQSDIADGSYPFHRPINIVSHVMEDKVGTGFVNFLHKEQSGRIILKSGLVPSIMPQRVINVNTDGIKTN